jgi:hypothetical protein
VAAEDQGDGREVFVVFFQHRHYVALAFAYITINKKPNASYTYAGMI